MRTDQHPPAFSLRSNTFIVSNAFSCAKASTAIAPAGPAPMMATDLIEAIFSKLMHTLFMKRVQA